MSFMPRYFYWLFLTMSSITCLAFIGGFTLFLRNALNQTNTIEWLVCGVLFDLSIIPLVNRNWYHDKQQSQNEVKHE